MIDGNKTHATSVAQILMGAIGIACFLKPDLVGVFSGIGVEILTPEQALLALAAGASQVLAGLKSIYSRMALRKVEKKVDEAAK